MLSLLWLAGWAGALKKKSFMEWIKPNGVLDKGAMNYVIVRTIQFKTQHASHGIVKMDKDGVWLKDFCSLTVQGGEFRGAAGDGNAITNALVTDMEPRFYMIELSDDDGAHSVAAYTSSSVCSFFDCNSGEANFDNIIQLRAYMPSYWIESGCGANYSEKTGTWFRRSR